MKTNQQRLNVLWISGWNTVHIIFQCSLQVQIWFEVKRERYRIKSNWRSDFSGPNWVNLSKHILGILWVELKRATNIDYHPTGFLTIIAGPILFTWLRFMIEDTWPSRNVESLKTDPCKYQTNFLLHTTIPVSSNWNWQTVIIPFGIYFHFVGSNILFCQPFPINETWDHMPTTPRVVWIVHWLT